LSASAPRAHAAHRRDAGAARDLQAGEPDGDVVDAMDVARGAGAERIGILGR
jgi:hypothetical protein